MSDQKTCRQCGAFIPIGGFNVCEFCEDDDETRVDLGGGMIVRLSELMDDE